MVIFNAFYIIALNVPAISLCSYGVENKERENNKIHNVRVT